MILHLKRPYAIKRTMISSHGGQVRSSEFYIAWDKSLDAGFFREVLAQFLRRSTEHLVLLSFVQIGCLELCARGGLRRTGSTLYSVFLIFQEERSGAVCFYV